MPAESEKGSRIIAFMCVPNGVTIGARTWLSPIYPFFKEFFVLHKFDKKTCVNVTNWRKIYLKW